MIGLYLDLKYLIMIFMDLFFILIFFQNSIEKIKFFITIYKI